MKIVPNRVRSCSFPFTITNALALSVSLLLSLVSSGVLAEEQDDAAGDDRAARKQSENQPKIAVSATATIFTCEESPQRIGRANLREVESSEGIKRVIVTLGIRNMSPGKHAVHVHETAKCEPCTAAGGHFDPGPHGHANPDGNHPFHSGDLANLEVNENGSGRLRTETTRISLSDGPLSIFDKDGSALIVHVDPDTYCPEGEEKGCAGGSRAACGIIKQR